MADEQEDRREEVLPLLARIERLREWRADARAVLGEWDRLANEVMERNGLTADQLGQSRASLVRSHLDWLNQQNDDLHDDVAKLLTRCEALAIDVAWRADWMTRAVNLLEAVRDSEVLEYGWERMDDLEQLLADEFGDGVDDD